MNEVRDQQLQQATKTVLDRFDRDEDFRAALRIDTEDAFRDIETDVGAELTDDAWDEIRALDWGAGDDDELRQQLLGIISNGSSWPPWSSD